MALNLLQNACAVSIYFRTFAPDMNGNQRETLRVRIISVGITCLAFVVFKPIGLDALGLMLYLHFLAIWALGVGVCYVTEGVVTHILGIPTSLDKGVEYIIRRNLWFQLMNTPLEALFICAYLHFPMSSIGATDPLTWKGILQVVLLLAFCSFIIGLYWRYKFRSRFLALELEETRELNCQLQLLQKEQPDVITLTGSTNEKVMLSVSNLLYIEAVGNYVKVVHWLEGQVRSDMLRATSKQMEDTLHDYAMIVRSHRAFIVNLGQVEHIVSKYGSMQLVMKYNHDAIPVSRSHAAIIKETIKGIL